MIELVVFLITALRKIAGIRDIKRAGQGLDLCLFSRHPYEFIVKIGDISSKLLDRITLRVKAYKDNTHILPGQLRIDCIQGINSRRADLGTKGIAEKEKIPLPLQPIYCKIITVMIKERKTR
jgi:hypothetical protein